MNIERRKIIICLDLLSNLKGRIVALSLVNSKLIIGHDFARSPHNLLLGKNNSIHHHKCTI
jgi:hypothetical protein